MDEQFWLERWRERAIGFHQEEVNSHLTEFWRRLSVPDGARVLVPLCGKSKDMLWLKEQGYQVLGVEISDIAVTEFFTENKLSFSKRSQGEFELYESDAIQIYQGDFFKLNASDLQDVAAVFDRASLIALPSEMRQDYVRKLQQCLPKSASILLISLEYPQNEMDGPPFSVKMDEINQLYHGQYGIECCSEVDALAENPRFRERGLSEMLEMVYLLRPQA